MISRDLLAAESGSFRDRDGRVYRCGGRILRGLSQTALADFRKLEKTSFYRNFQTTGALVASWECGLEEVPLPPAVLDHWAGFLEHQPIAVISYPYEWTFGMLRDAALLQLDLLEAAIGEGMSLKDATPYNIQFSGGKPVFIDVASFISLESGAAWAGYRQFCEMFLFPLMLQAYKGIDFQPFLRAGIDGVDVQTAARLFSLRDRFRPGVFSHVWLQSKFDRRYAGTQQNVRASLKSAGFNREMILANVRRSRKLVSSLKWQGDRSEWAGYAEFHNYSSADHELKESFIESCVAASKPAVVWDIGCNTGQFAKIAARHAGLVLAMDLDHFAVECLYRELKTGGGGNILPMVQNVANPSPNWGWQNRERTELKARAAPDLVLCLALIHHIVITANIPLDEFIAWLAGLAQNLVIEYVSRSDEKVQTLLRNKDDQYADYSRDGMEKALERYYTIERRQSLGDGRRHLYWCRLRTMVQNPDSTKAEIRTAHPNGHFYSPAVDPSDLLARSRSNSLWPLQAPQILGVDFNRQAHETVLDSWFPRHISRYDYPELGDEHHEDEKLFYTRNSQFSWLDSRALFVFLNEIRPARMIEVGSGYSSLLAADVNRRFLGGSCAFQCIEPYPRDFLLTGVAGISELIIKKVQDVPLEHFESLNPGDILFIDSSHVCKTGSDVNFLYFEVLPRLKSGVFIHVHDIFLPLEYPREWVIEENRSWNEQYLLRALLMYSDAFKVFFACNYAFCEFPEKVIRALALPSGAGFGGGSFWLSKV